MSASSVDKKWMDAAVTQQLLNSSNVISRACSAQWPSHIYQFLQAGGQVLCMSNFSVGILEETRDCNFLAALNS